MQNMQKDIQTSTQMVFARCGDGYVTREFPPADEVLGATRTPWGRAEEICTPAYWAAQAWMWEVEAPDHYKLGRTLAEELMACILGGYGIPAEVGLAAYERLRKVHSVNPLRLENEAEVFSLLSEPLVLDGKKVRYRFAKQKAKYISASLRGVKSIDLAADDRSLRDQLTKLPGIGLKTASWILRNWRGSDNISILDIHILRAGRIIGIFLPSWSVERDYLLLERAFLDFADALSVRASFLDSVMWMNMRQLPMDLVRGLVGSPSLGREVVGARQPQLEFAL